MLPLIFGGMAACLTAAAVDTWDWPQTQADVIQSVEIAERYLEKSRFTWWKRAAKGKFHAMRTGPAQRAILQLEVAAASVEARLKEFHNGRGTLDFFLDSARRLLDAELTVCKSPGEKTAAHERYWELMKHVELTDEERYNAQRISRKDLALSRYHRVEAEQLVVNSRNEYGAAPRASLVSRLPVSDNLVQVKQLAKARRALAFADPKALAATKLEEARIECQARLNEFINGRGTMHFLQDASRRRWGVEREIAKTPDGKLVALENYWQRCLFYETINQVRFNHGRVGIRELCRPMYWRYDTQRQLALDRKDANATLIPHGPKVDPYIDYYGAKKLAKAKWQAANDPAIDAARRKLSAAATIVHTGTLEFVNGRGTLPFVLESYRMLLNSVSDVDPTPAARAAATAQYWELAKMAESINKERYDAGRLPLHEYLETLYDLLTADGLLIESKHRSKE